MSSSLSSWSTAPMGAGRLLQDARWGVAGFLPAARGCKFLVVVTAPPLRARCVGVGTNASRRAADPRELAAIPQVVGRRPPNRVIGVRGRATALVRQAHQTRRTSGRSFAGLRPSASARVSASITMLEPLLLPARCCQSGRNSLTGQGREGRERRWWRRRERKERREKRWKGGSARGCTTHTLICAR